MPRSGAVGADHATDIGPPRQVRAVHAGLLLALVGAVYVFAPIGFNPTDDGLIVAQSARLLDGASPHLQVISPRPLGSPILHTVDVLLPTPLLYTSRAIAVLEFMVIAGLSVLLLRRTRLSRWGPAEAGLTLVPFSSIFVRFPCSAGTPSTGSWCRLLRFVSFEPDASVKCGQWSHLEPSLADAHR